MFLISLQVLEKIFLGTSGWSYNEWVGPFYKSRKNKLSYYSKVFKTAEIDSTFYSFPQEGFIWGWLKATESDFTFTAKLPQLITHEKKLNLKKGVEHDLKRFCELMRPLQQRGRLGCFLIQLPPKFRYELNILEDFFSILPKDFRFAVEFRHISWMKSNTWKLLENYNVAYTIVDEPLLPPEVHITSDFVYIRWHGKGDRPWFNYLYKKEELVPWIPRIKEVSDSTEKVYGYFNNHFHGYAVENCLQVLEMLGELSPKQVEAKRVADEYLKEKYATKTTLDLFTFIQEGVAEKTELEELLEILMDSGRLRRAREIKDETVSITEVSNNAVRASVKDYRVTIDFKNHRILHDCVDWSRYIPQKQFCKHLGKIFLMLPELKSLEILRQIHNDLDGWEFKIGK